MVLWTSVSRMNVLIVIISLSSCNSPVIKPIQFSDVQHNALFSFSTNWSWLIYCWSGNILEVLIFAKRTNLRVQESRKKYYYSSATTEKWKFAKFKLREKFQNQKFEKIYIAKITRSRVSTSQGSKSTNFRSWEVTEWMNGVLGYLCAHIG